PGVLLDQDDGRAAPADLLHDVEDLPRDQRSQAEAGLVEQEQPGLRHQRARWRASAAHLPRATPPAASSARPGWGTASWPRRYAQPPRAVAAGARPPRGSAPP